MKSIQRIRKRDGSIVPFNNQRIENVIFNAAQSVGGKDRKMAEKLAGKVVEELVKRFDETRIPAVEDVQDTVEKILIENGHAATAKAFILYREKRREMRQTKMEVAGKPFKSPISVNAMHILKERYLLKDAEGTVMETPDEMFQRVARDVSQADAYYGANESQRKQTEERFYMLMQRLVFLPSTPTLMNAGTSQRMLSTCSVIPVEDSMDSIFSALKAGALTHQAGGGTGYAFSRIRPKKDRVRGKHGVASGPVSFLHVFDASSDAIRQGGKRRSANMGVLRVDHPDILEFISIKHNGNQLQSFNLSVGLTDAFMNALKKKTEYALVNPRNQKEAGKMNAEEVWQHLVSEAWLTGDPGVIFLDEINRTNPTPALGRIEATNPCGEAPLLAYEPCPLGSIRVSSFVDQKELNWKELKKAVHDAIHFLDNVIDRTQYPLPQMGAMTRGNRKIGLGIMGFGDLLYMMRIPYNSTEGIAFAEKLMAFISMEADAASEKLAVKRGAFPNWRKSVYSAKGRKLRNATRTCIAPTRTIGMIADCSPGIEPVYALSYEKHVLEGDRLRYANPLFEEAVQEKGHDLPNVLKQISATGSSKGVRGLSPALKRVFVTARGIAPEWHVRMQAAFQKHTDLGVSKTIHFAHSATPNEVGKAMRLAYELDCKGIAVHRNQNRLDQVLQTGSDEEPVMERTEDKEISEEKREPCPNCRNVIVYRGNCATCNKCGAVFCVS
ncbi:adenosylcobalamin-dependent ribonucleoside-diphosphate reductase [Candidatus Micrarchaeota archaeon]|nr:adenosylcobalamin-dependent ribonucleoside-diphosphate reductase [Candidatus Micrarchaeota archaeon]